MSPFVQVLIVAAGTYAFRASAVLAIGRGAIPPAVERTLRMVAPAVLAALVADTLLLEGASFRAPDSWYAAAAIATAVALTTRSTSWTLAAGMGALWALQAVT